MCKSVCKSERVRARVSVRARVEVEHVKVVLMRDQVVGALLIGVTHTEVLDGGGGD